jgi:GntR family transcriptional regulator/MocR family aminotransferase
LGQDHERVDLHIRLRGEARLGAQIYARLRAAILDGSLGAGARLPPTRELAERLAVSRNTVAAAYERLTAEGFLSGRAGAGTFVSAEAVAAAAPHKAPSRATLRPRAVWTALVAGRDVIVPEAATPPPRYDFRLGTPDARLFPVDEWRRLVAQRLRRITQNGGYAEATGHAGLRAAIARYVAVSRSVRAGSDDIVVTSGAQQAIDLVARVLLAPGACVAVEEPGYPPVRQLLAAHGARVVPVPVDGEGLKVAALPDAARLVYVTPSHQFPLGMAMSLERRLMLLAWAERRDAVIIEDDYDSEFRFAGRPLEPLQSLDRTGRVLYVGSFSKVLLPMLRLGFVVAPASLRPALAAAKRLCDWHCELVGQAALARFIDDGLLARHIRKMTREYQARRERILHLLEGKLGAWLTPIAGPAGLHLAALADRRRFSVERALALAAEAGVALSPLSLFFARPPGRPGLVLGYGGIALGRIDDGLRYLGDCIRAAS